MKKSVYSLVLSDDIVEEIDRLAYSKGFSRSAMINEILAEAVSYTTPEKRMNDIFGAIESLMESTAFQIQPQPSDAMLSIRSALRYKYKPVIRYGLELYRSFDKTIGQLKVSFRTQSENLKADLTEFLKLWAELENKYIVRFFPEGISYTIDDGKFTRTFRLPEAIEHRSNDDIAQAISEYIPMYDEILKIDCAKIEHRRVAAQLSVDRYYEYLEHGIVII
ncbi:MAG: hypothetical protein IJY73_04720 [Oscillospiraceae bacterium]|nr:hypothetical protein [Oscillospiraceae bacterium]